MKTKYPLILFVILVGLGYAGVGRAASSHPCSHLKDACEAAGFHQLKHKQGNGLWVNCLLPLLNGQSVKGVTASVTDIKGCQAERAKDGK